MPGMGLRAFLARLGTGQGRRDICFVLAVTALCAIILALPEPFRRAGEAPPANSARARGRVLAVDNAMVKMIGPVKQGEQQLELEILSGRFKGWRFSGVNNLIGKIELDKLYAPGDPVLLGIDLDGSGGIAYVNVIDHYRSGKSIVLLSVFALVLILISGLVGLKVLVSVAFSAICLVRFLLPAMLVGWDPILATLLICVALSAVIIFLVGGLNRVGLSAFCGAIGGVFLSAALASVFTYWFKLHGATRPFAESLLYSGFGHLNIVHLFISGIFLASSGAVMDLAMDIAVALGELKAQKPELGPRAIFMAGLRVSRHVTGTMVTTLVLAYSAEYTAMLMTFVAQGVPFENVVNLVYVSSEIVHTFVGCFGLILVAPLTVLFSALIIGKGPGFDKPTARPYNLAKLPGPQA